MSAVAGPLLLRSLGSPGFHPFSPRSFHGTRKKMKVSMGNPMGGPPRSKTLAIDVRPGWKAGTKVTFDAEPDGSCGAITFVLQEKPHACVLPCCTHENRRRAPLDHSVS